MPISLLPIVMSVFLVGTPIIAFFIGRKTFVVIAVSALGIFMAILVPIYLPGWLLMKKATDGDPVAQYELAQWYENHCEEMQEWLIWPCEPDVESGYRWLEKAATQEYPKAIYTLGVRLKYGQHVPRPNDWAGQEGNSFPQPTKGEALIKRAIELGYEPFGNERYYYMKVFRRSKWIIN